MNQENLPQGDDKKEPKAAKPFYKIKTLNVILLSLLAVATVCCIVLIPIFSTKAVTEAVIKIPRNADRETVRDSLSKYLGQEFADRTIRMASLRGTDFSTRHGAYLIEEGMSPAKAERRLAKGAQYPFKVVINNFKTPERLAEKLELKLDFSADSFLNVVNDPVIIEKYGVSPEKAFVLFPEATYEVFWNISPEEFINKTASHYHKIWNEERTQKTRDLGLTPEETVILCSIVDEESNKADDKGKIGRLYINRIHKGMKLQADPTVKYALGDFGLRRIRNEHLKTESPYNTYRVAGLPPGPIRTTSVVTIDSVLNSAPNGYIYMCAKDDFSGYHAFATTYDEHLKNARKYQQALNRRGIK